MDLNMSVLIVDDFATMRRILKNILRQTGFTNITEADNGKAALNELKGGGVDLILCDWNMPEMSGIELLTTMKSDDELKNIPFVMVTAEAQSFLGFFVLKHYEPNELNKPRCCIKIWLSF